MQVCTPVSYQCHSSNRRAPAYGNLSYIRWRKLRAIDYWFNILQAGIPFCCGSIFDLVPSRGNSISESFIRKRKFPYKSTIRIRWADPRTTVSSFQIILTGAGCWSNLQGGICAKSHQCHSATDAHPLMKKTSNIQSSDLKLSIPTLRFYKRALVMAVVNFVDGFPRSTSKKLHIASHSLPLMNQTLPNDGRTRKLMVSVFEVYPQALFVAELDGRILGCFHDIFVSTSTFARL
jgi:hypothetical protein